MMRTCFVMRGILLAAIVLFCFSPRPAAAQDAQQPAQQPQYTIPEYNAYQAAANEKDAKQKIALFDAFVTKFPNSTLLPYVYQAYWETYLELRNYPKVIEYTEKFLAMGDKNPLQNRLTATYRHSAVLEVAYNPKDPNAKDYLTKGRDIAQQGLKLLDQFPKPDKLTDEQFAEQVKKPVALILYGAAGFASLQLKDYQAAADSFKAVLALTPTDAVASYRLGLAYMAMTPQQSFDGFWALARAIDLKIPDTDKIKDYLRKSIANFEQPTCDNLIDAQLAELLQLAANSPGRPSTWSVPAAADLAKIAQSSTIITVINDLKAGGDKAKLTWLAICGAEFPEVVGKVIEVTPGADSVELHMFTGATPEEMEKATTANMDVKVVGQADASRLQKDDPARFSGTLAGYDPDPAFMLHWDKAKVNPEDIPAEKGKRAPRKAPAKPGN
jgi:tetratricopeptide (TPR) repeat protein